MKRSLVRKLLAVIVGVIVLTVGARWLYGLSPYGQVMKLIYSDIPVQVVPVDLATGAPTVIRTRIIKRSIYDLNLLVYFDSSEQRDSVEELIGGPVGQPGNVARRPGRRTNARIVVRDAEDKVIHDRAVLTEGRVITGTGYLARRLDTFELGEGIYEISVTFLSDVSRFSRFRVALHVYYLAN